MRRFLPALLLLFAPLAFAQNQTIVTGTLTDPNGVPYYPATVSACLTPATLYPMVAGQQVNNNPGTNYCFGPVSTASNGSFLMSLWGNALITCSPACPSTQWLFTVVIPGPVAPVGFGPQQFTATITISGNQQNIGATLNAAGVSQLRPAGAATNATNLVGPGAITGTFSGTHTETGNVTSNQLNGCQYVSASQTLIQAIAAVSNPGCIAVSINYALTTSPTVPAGVTLVFLGGGSITTTGFTLTISGPIIAPANQIFFGSGTAIVNQPNLKAVWWGGTIDQQINACAASLLSNGLGTCDATDLRTGTIAAQINWGDHATSTAMELLLPAGGTWQVSITNGTSCGIQQNDKATIIGKSTANGNLMTIVPLNSSTNVYALYCTDPAPIGSGGYYKAEGFGVVNTVGATMAKGAAVVQHVFDQSQFSKMDVINSNGAGLKLADVCCGTAFINMLADGKSGAGALPLVIGDATIGGLLSGGVADILIDGGSFTHPGTGLNAVTIAPIVFTQAVNFQSPYIEPHATDTTTAGMSIGANVQGVTVTGLKFANNAGGSTSYAIDVANWAGPGNHFFTGIISQTSNCVNDHVTGVTQVSAGSNGQCSPFASGGMVVAGPSAAKISLAPSAGVDLAPVSGNAMRHGTAGGSYFFDLGNATFRDGNGSTGGSLAAKSFLPTSAGGTDLGTTALPFGNLWFGTAATNNFKLAPAATTGARTWNIPDWGANGSSTQNQPFVITLTSQYTNSTTTFSNVAGGNTIQFAVAANQNYTATCHLYYQAAATGGLNIEFTGPASPTAVRYGMDLPTAVTGVASGEADAFGTSIGAVSTAGAVNLDAMVSFSLLNGANAGTVNLLAKSSAAVQLQIQSGSWCRIQ